MPLPPPPQRRLAAALLGLLIAIMGLTTLFHAGLALEEPHVYRKDYLQDYLMSAAWRDGLDPYLPVAELEKSIIQRASSPIFSHPSPHPPSAILLFAPLTSVDYQTSAALWWLIELILLAVAVYALLTLASWQWTFSRFFFFYLASLGARAVYVDLISGQLSLLLTVLLIACYGLLRNGREIYAGVALGIALVLKFFAWPVLLYLILSKRLRAFSSAAIVILALSLVQFAALGLEIHRTYWIEVISRVPTLYIADQHNQSLFSLGQKIFGGLGPGVKMSISAPPLIDLPQLVFGFGFLVSLLVVALALYAAVRSRDLDIALPLLCCVSVLVPPVAWVHSHSICFLALVPLYKRHSSGVLSVWELRLGSLFLLLLYLGDLPENIFIGNLSQVNFMASLLTWIPMLSVLALSTLLAQMALRNHSSAETIN